VFNVVTVLRKNISGTGDSAGISSRRPLEEVEARSRGQQPEPVDCSSPHEARLRFLEATGMRIKHFSPAQP